MVYDFESCPQRWGMNASKWEPLEKTKYAFSPEIVPLSTADMELRCCPEIVAEVTRLAQFGLYGYGSAGADFFQAVCGWMEKRHAWQAQPEWLVPYAGVVPALFTCVQAFTEPGDGVIIQTPVYFPFRMAIEKNGRRVLCNRLLEQEGCYTIDFADLEEKCQAAKMLILCSPHNPVGRVWTAEELRRLGEICQRHGVLVIADEIHHDLVLGPNTHYCYAALGEAFARNCVVATAASKSFNLAGFTTSSIFIPNPALRARFQQVSGENGVHYTSYMGPAATIAAYSKGAAWLDALLEHLQGNFTFLKAFLAEKLPNVRISPLEGTYLAWLDFRSFGLDSKALETFLQADCGLFLNAGEMFGQAGAGFARMNIACSRPVLQAALARLHDGAQKRGLA